MWNVKRATIVASLGTLILGAVLGIGLLGAAKEEKAMDVTNNRPVADTSIPAIDMLIPNNTATATFALG